MAEHTPEFIRLRDAVLALEESDRKRLADLLGAMTVPQPALSGPVVEILAAFGTLPESDRHRLSVWFGTYVNRWGQIPVMAGRRVVSESKSSA